MLVEDIMTEGLICVDMEESIVEVARIMNNENIGLVGVTENERLVGVLTDRDIVTKIINNKSLRIAPFITRNVITIEKHQTIDDALDIMGDNRIKRLIVTESKNPIGLISISDILTCGFTSLLSDTFSKIYRVENKKND